MSDIFAFGLNHITTPRLNSRELIDLARRLGCIGVELRNDLVDKRLSKQPFFDGEDPREVGAFARSRGVRLVGLSEVYGFNRWTDEIRIKVERLIGEALASGAESISLIPSNDGRSESDTARLDDLRNALSRILPMLAGTDLLALVEPLGFETSSLRLKREAICAIEEVGGQSRYRLVHDTFHHFLAGEQEFFPEWIGIVHISSVSDPHLGASEMRDENRILIAEKDRLGNVAQIARLSAGGYQGAYSYECFAQSVHQSSTYERDIRVSLEFIRESVRSVSTA